MHQRENCSGRANAEGQRQDSGDGENGRIAELPQGIADVFHRFRLPPLIHTNPWGSLFNAMYRNNVKEVAYAGRRAERNNLIETRLRYEPAFAWLTGLATCLFSLVRFEAYFRR